MRLTEGEHPELTGPHVLSLRSVRSRKTRRCIWCGIAIPELCECIYRVAVYGSRGFLADYWHKECYDATQELEDFTFEPYVQPYARVDRDRLGPPAW